MLISESYVTSDAMISIGNVLIAGTKEIIAGSAAGMAVVATGHPFDTIKVRMQSSPTLYNGPIDCLKKTLVEGGIKGLYAGAVPAFAANIGENAVLFLCYSHCKALLQQLQSNPDAPLSHLQLATAGGMASVFASAVLCPTELVKCRMQALKFPSRKPMFRNSLQCARYIIRTEGTKGLFRGLSSTFAREIPGNIAFFGGYEVTRSTLCSPGQTVDQLSVPSILFAGGVGGASFWLASYPCDVVKTRIQVEGSDVPFIRMLLNIINKEGPRTLFRGLSPTIIRAFPSNAALFLAYEASRKLMS